MTISSNSRKAGPYSGNDVATAFAFAFKVFSEADVLVVFTSASNAETVLTLTTDYTVTLNADQDTNPGGSVTLPAALVTGTKLTITSSVADLQPVTLTNNGGFYPRVINDALDRATIQIQQLKEKLSRALVWPISFSGATLPIPEASKFIGWNATADSLVNLSGVAVGDAQTVLFAPAGTGAVATDVQSKLRESVSVKDFGAVGDGVTSDQSAVAAAVAAAYTTGDWLYWPKGTYVSTATIPNFHSVHHFGPGIIKRGSDLFHVAPIAGATNNLYVATTGSAANDGLSSLQPKATFQNAFDALKNYGPVLNGYWVVRSAAGTYTGAAALNQLFDSPSKNRVTIKGPDVGGHPNVPTCIFDGTGGAAYQHGMRVSDPDVRAQVQDIKFIGYNNGGGDTTRIGLVGESSSDLYTMNVHGDGASWTNVYAFNTANARINGGILENGRSNFIANDTQATLGYGASSLAEGTILRGATESGVYWSRGAQGHIDYCTMDSNAVGAVIDANARAHGVSNNYKNNTIAIHTSTGGVYLDDGNDFNNGTANANTQNIQYHAYSGEVSELRNGESWLRVAADRTTRNASGVTSGTFPVICTIPAYRLQGASKSARVSVKGIWTVTTSSTLVITLGGMNVTFTTPGAGSGLVFELDIDLMEVGGGYRAIGRLLQGASQHRMASSGSGFSATDDAAISIGYSLTGAGDVLSIYRTDVYLMG